ncbi:hypothetical protein FO519_002312 [Halicephalobus sp. NKZ332]|nr:hypothetical protein FO519_002312 [Halicephalobus sp. NKZ332]
MNFVNFVGFLFLFILFSISAGELNDVPAKHNEEHKDHIKVSNKNEQHIDEVKIYQQLLKKKRMEQSTAVKNLIQMGDGEKQKKTVLELISAMSKVLSSARTAIEGAKYDPKSKKFPDDQKLRERICEVLENTPFFLEFSLYYPNIVRKAYKNGNIEELIRWTYQFSMDFNIYDDSTLKMINLGAQELNIIERSEDFFNPYDKLAMRDMKQLETMKAAKEAKAEKERKKKEYQKKQKRQNGPSLSRSEL